MMGKHDAGREFWNEAVRGKKLEAYLILINFIFINWTELLNLTFISISQFLQK